MILGYPSPYIDWGFITVPAWLIGNPLWPAL